MLLWSLSREQGAPRDGFSSDERGAPLEDGQGGQVTGDRTWLLSLSLGREQWVQGREQPQPETRGSGLGVPLCLGRSPMTLGFKTHPEN